ncbi:MAG: porin family protein [Tannerellaceae bacterium]|nr:porin family protein [Tannerellaceae bacterium]
MRRYGWLIFLFCFSIPAGFAQEYKYEIGINAGAGFYMGDVNHTIPFKNSWPAIGAQIRYNINSRWALRGNVTGSKISGSGGPEKYPFLLQQVSFKREILDVGVRSEFNFLDYKNPERFHTQRTFTPFLCIGVGWLFSPSAEINYTGFNIPGGVGLKFRIAERFNLMAEFTFYKLFTDRLDVTDKSNSMLDDPYGLSNNCFKNKDWYFLWSISLSWDFGKRRMYCN